jgi:multisubunit Na+/H+ antiporter MnhC subunit
MLIILGLVLVAAGVVVTLAGRWGIPLGRLPGDIRIQGKNSSFYFPLTTCLILSAVVSLAMWLLRR